MIALEGDDIPVAAWCIGDMKFLGMRGAIAKHGIARCIACRRLACRM
jgi:hypothetical protein